MAERRSPSIPSSGLRLARRLFGAGQGLGARVRISRRPGWQDALVVGIARDASVFDVRGGDQLIGYTPAIQSGSLANYKFLIARAPETAAPSLQRAIDDLGMEYIARFQTVEYSHGRTILQERVLAGLNAFFGALALLLVSVGVSGLLSYALSMRRKEFGIRLALGAEPARIAAQLAGSVAATMTAGIATGLALTVLTSPGRTFTREELVPAGRDAPFVLVVSHAAWSRLFGRDLAMVGKAIKFAELPVTITVVGIASPLRRGSFMTRCSGGRRSRGRGGIGAPFGYRGRQPIFTASTQEFAIVPTRRTVVASNSD